LDDVDDIPQLRKLCNDHIRDLTDSA